MVPVASFRRSPRLSSSLARSDRCLLRQLQELENNANLLLKTKSGLASSLEEQKRLADDEARERSSLLGKYRNM